MNQYRDAEDGRQLEPTLARAVQAILAEPVPEELAERVKDRARRLPAAVADESPTTARDARPIGSAFRRRFFAWSASAAAAAIVLVAVWQLATTARPAMAAMLEAVAKQPWIHGTTTYAEGKREAKSEFWFSPTHRVVAGKFDDRLQFDDLEQEVSFKYDAKDGTLYRVASLTGNDRGFLVGRLPELLQQLVGGQAGTSELFHGERVVKAQQQEQERDGRRWLEYVVRLERVGNPNLKRTVRIRLDARTQLPVLWEERRAGGATAVTKFDYPDTGPSDVYELGVPKSAPLVDRVPRDDLARVIAAQQAARKRFDPYDAIVVQHGQGATTRYETLMNLSVYRVRREGARYRVDRLLLPKEGLVPPTEDTSMTRWWRKNRDRYWSVPLLICDGTTIHFYDMLDDRIVPGQKPNLSVVSRATQAVGVPPGDAAVPWPQLMPEQCGHPHLWPSVETRRFEVDAGADDGPPGSVRVIVARSSGPRAGELFRYWFDPDRDYVLTKEIGTVFDPESDEVAYRNIEEYDDFAQSPGGKWFPQRVRRTTTDNADWTGITRFYLDFDADLDSRLFVPVPEQ